MTTVGCTPGVDAAVGRRGAVFAIALVVSACGAEGTATGVTEAAGATTTTTSTSSTVPATTASTAGSTVPTTTTEDPTAAVEQAFHDQWDAFVEITSDPAIENPLIGELFTGPAKEAVLDGVSKLIADGQAFRLPEDPAAFRPRIVGSEMADRDTAIVYECTVEGLVIVDVASGAVVNDEVSSYERRNQFERVDGRWLLSRTTPVDDEEPGCAEP